MERKAAFVTGSSRGIGRGIVQHLARAGWDVAINYVSSREAAEETARLCEAEGARTFLVQADIADTASHEGVLEGLVRHFGRLDLVVSNAGVAPKERKDLLEAGEESFDFLIGTNLKGPYFLFQKAARYFLSRAAAAGPDLPPDTRPGMLINVTSISAYTASVNRGDYCVSKAGLSMVTRLFADRLAAHGIPVYEIRPGIIRTDMTAGVTDKYEKLIGEGLTPIRRWGMPDDIGRAVVALAEGYFPFSTGEVFNVDGGFHLKRL